MPIRGAVYVNGKIARAEDAVIPVYDHGFLYGEGVYETLRTYNLVPFLYERHARRLRESAAYLELDVPFTDDQLLKWIDDTVAAAGAMDEAYIRVLLTRGVGELTYDVASTPVPSLVIIVKPLDEPPARMFTDGIRVALVPILRNHPGSVNPIIKSNNLLNNALAMQEANRRGAEEGLMCNYRGELSECSQSNFFMVRGGVALTPEVARRAARGDHAVVPVRRRTGRRRRGPRRDAVPEGPRERRRGVHHEHDARAEPGDADRRPPGRHRQAGTDHDAAARGLSQACAGAHAGGLSR